MSEVSMIGLDLAKNVFQAHGASASGAVVFRKKLRRDQLLGFFAVQPRCLVAMEACPGAHHWGRELFGLGFEVKLIAPRYVKPFVKRQKNDMADAEAICEAAQRPTIATAIQALAPAAETFSSGRDFAAWVGLTPLQKSSGGKTRLGRASRIGERTLGRLMIIGANGVIRWAKRKGVPTGSWLAGMLARKPPMLIIVALANKIARTAWALLAKGGTYRAPAVAA